MPPRAPRTNRNSSRVAGALGLAGVAVAVAMVAVTAAAGCGKQSAGGSAGAIRVAAAADLAFAFKEIGAEFQKATGTKVSFTFGSTGQLAQQISEGAPYDVFAAANVSYVQDTVKADACDGATMALYARGRIAMWSKKGGAAPPATLGELTDARFVKIAIANPEHAPYGKAAKQALETAGVWEAVKPKVVYGENVQQTLQFAQTDNAEVAIVALSLATVSDEGTYTTIDEAQHKPIDQALVVCKRGKDKNAALAFTKYVGSAEGRAIMQKYGFLLPGEALVKIP